MTQQMWYLVDILDNVCYSDLFNISINQSFWISTMMVCVILLRLRIQLFVAYLHLDMTTWKFLVSVILLRGGCFFFSNSRQLFSLRLSNFDNV